MKKRLLLTLAALSTLTIGLASCGTNTSTSTSTSTSVAPSYEDATIKIGTADGTQIEKGNSITVKATVNTAAENKTSNWTFSEGYESIIETPDLTYGVGSIKITGKAVGTVSITATSVANPTVTKTISVEVIAAKPSLRAAWKNIASLKNYTLKGVADETGTSTAAESVIKVTDKAITQTLGGESLYFSDSTKTANRLGIGLDKDGYAMYLDQNKTDKSFVSPAVRATSSLGFLTADTFTGAGTAATSVNDVSLFYGLAAVNPNWLTSTKTDDNVYVIEGTQTDQNAAMVEFALWQLIDPASCSAFLSSISGDVYFYAIAAAVNTTIEVVGKTEVKINLSLASSETDKTIGTLTDIGTTAQADDVNTFLGDTTKAVSEAPALTGTLGSIKTTMDQYGKINYVQKNIIQLKTGYISYNSYYSENYFFAFQDEAFVTAYNAASGKSLTVGGSGVYNVGGQLFKFTIDAAGKVTKAATASATLPTGETFGQYIGYIGYTDIFNGGMYALGSTAGEIFTGMGSYYFTSSAAVALAHMDYYWGETETADSYYSGMNAVFNSTDPAKIDTIKCFFGYGANNSYHVSQYELSQFGTSTTNDYNAAIVAAFAA